MKRPALCVLASLLAACVGPDVAVDRAYDFSRVKRVGVVAFDGAGGPAAADLLAHELLAAGASVAERSRLESVLAEQRMAKGGLLSPADIRRAAKALNVDALFMGTVTQYSPAQSYLVLSSSGAVFSQGVAPLGGGRVTQSPALGAPGASVLTSSAQVGLTARLVDVHTGAVVWSAHQSYEGFDADSAMSAVARSFARGAVPLWVAR